jgi:hypothetical protein
MVILSNNPLNAVKRKIYLSKTRLRRCPNNTQHAEPEHPPVSPL